MPTVLGREGGRSIPLPSNDFLPGTPLHDAYETCIHLERKDAWNQYAAELTRPFSEGAMMEMSPKTVARVLGYALRLAPNLAGRDVLVQEIIGCKSEPEDRDCSPELLAGLAYLYVFGLIRVFYNPKGPTPYISTEQSPRRFFEDAVNKPSHLMQPSPVTASTLRTRVSYRDDHRCVLTGALDTEEFMRMDDESIPQQLQFVTTQTAHIISQFLSTDIDGLSERAQAKFRWGLTAVAVIERFGGFSACAILGDDNLNSASNAFTLSQTPHDLFDQLNLWLVPATDHGFLIPNTYDVKSVKSKVFAHGASPIKQRVVFRQATMDDGTVVPPPSPELLALHAACAQVAHLSAAAEHLQDIFCDPDVDCVVMTQPNAVSVLTQKLKALQVIPLLVV